VSSSLKDSNDAFGRLAPAKVQAFMEEVRRVRSEMGASGGKREVA
jgi:hypothetical protein